MEHVISLKHLINQKALKEIKEYLLEADIDEISQNADYIFQKVYIHTCLLIGKYKKKHDTVSVDKLIAIEKFLKEECFPKLPEIQRIAIRQCFSYGKYLSSMG
jgi:hypothetical protein